MFLGHVYLSNFIICDIAFDYSSPFDYFTGKVGEKAIFIFLYMKRFSK